MAENTIHILRTKNEKGNKIWIAFDKQQILSGKERESKDNLLFRWGKSVGRFFVLIQYPDAMSRAEAAATIAELQQPIL